MAKPTTTDELARMINAGFNAVTQEIGEVKQCLGRIEHLLLEAQNRKIENLEARMKKLEDALAV